MPVKSLVFRSLPNLLLSFFTRYLRVEVEGIENLPANGRMILLPNHSGFMGFDALLLSHFVRRKTGRIPRVMLHRLWFAGGFLNRLAQMYGFVEASYRNGLASLKKNNMIMLFPEAEEGNFKPINERYKLRPYRNGFVKLAAKTKAPVVPVLIIGAEETHITIGQLKILNQLLPLPLNAFPLPAKWKIKFLEPIRFDERFDAAGEKWREDETTLAAAAEVRTKMQSRLNSELAQRKYIYFDRML